jgi:formate hydrogenlyase transcriptional activator
MPDMASSGPGSARLNIELLVDSIPSLIHTARPDGYLDYFNKPWLEYMGVTLDKVAGWNWTAFIHPEDLDGIVTKWRACLATGETFEYETRVRRANGDYRWMFHRKVPLRDENGNIVKWYGSSLDIDERKTAEEQLRRNAEELQRSEFYLAEGQRLAHMGSWAFDPNGFYYWSPELFRMHGLDWASKPPSVQEYLDRVHPHDREYMANLINGILAKASPFDATKRIVRPNGEVRYIRCVGAPVVENQSVKKCVGSAIDVTEHELLTQELRRREAYLAEAQRLSHTGSFGWKSDTGEIIWSDETYRIFGYDRSVRPTIDSVLQRVHPQDRTEFQRVVDGASWRPTDFEHTYRLLLPDGRVKHVHALAHALRNASGNREFVGAVTDITERKTAEEALRNSKAYLAEAQRLSHTGSWAWSPDTDIRHWSEECYRVLGFDPRDGAPRLEELIQRIHPDDQPAFRESAERAMHNQFDEELDYRIVHPDGAVRNIHSIGHPVFSPSGDLIVYTGSVIDITERKRAEEELRASERKYRHLIDTTPAFIHTALPDGSLDFMSRGWLEYGGLPQTDLMNWRWTAAIHPEDVEEFVDKWRAALASGEPFEAESRVRRADGEYRWFLQRNVPLRDETGQIVKWYGTGVDIEERKRAEDKIRERETELRQVLDFAPQLVSVYGPNRERLYANRRVLDYLGIDHDEWLQRSPGTNSHPDDSERVNACWDRALESGSGYDVELRLRKHDGSYRWFLARYNPVHDEQGQTTRWYVTGTDIEDRKRAEERLQHENIALREEIDKTSMFEEIVGASSSLQPVLSHISKVAPSDSTVLITGETGTGKELVARAIHRRSARSSRPFISVNCAAIPRDLVASELFGHEKGAFTGATQQRLGRFELASGGTIFLDEVGELPAETQISLLRVLQEREFERVGGNRRIRSDVRVVAATNRDLQAAISAGSFRSDLFYRLNVFPIEIPSLRERRADIPLLVEYFIDRYARRVGKNIKHVNKKTLDLLQAYSWPGNIRELQNVIERSVILCETEIFSIDGNWIPQRPPVAPESKEQVELPQRLLGQEKVMIEAALKDTGGRVSGPTGAAVRLGIPRSTLESKIRSLKIDKNRFKV